MARLLPSSGRHLLASLLGLTIYWRASLLAFRPRSLSDRGLKLIYIGLSFYLVVWVVLIVFLGVAYLIATVGKHRVPFGGNFAL